MWPHCGIHSVSLYDICTGNKHHLIQVGLLSISTSRQATPLYIDSALPSPRAVIVKIAARYRFRFLSQVKEEFRRSYYIDNIKSPEIRLTYTRLRIDNNVYSSYMRSKVVGTYMCPVCYRGEDTIKHLLFSCQYFDKQRMEINDEMCKALPNWPSFDISTKFKLLLDLQCPDYLFQTCSTYVHELHSKGEKYIWLFQR